MALHQKKYCYCHYIFITVNLHQGGGGTHFLGILVTERSKLKTFFEFQISNWGLSGGQDFRTAHILITYTIRDSSSIHACRFWKRVCMMQVFINARMYGSVRKCFPISCHRNNNPRTKYQKESNAYITFLYCSFQGGVLHLYCER